MKYCFKAFKNYAVIDGRSSRKEYWCFMIFTQVIACLLLCLVKMSEPQSITSRVLALIGIIYICAIMCPTICLEIRRLHDVGKRGVWWLRLVPLLNIYFWYLILLKRGQTFPNEYGKALVTINKKSKSKTPHNNKKQKKRKH